MTEKQFKINTSEIGYIYIDNPKGEHMSWVELEKTLNRLYAQNKELFKENKELKQFIGAIYDLIDGYIAIADEYRKPIKSLTIGDDLGYWNGVYQYMKKLRERIGIL